MFDFIKKNIFIGLIFIISLSVGFLTFLTFIGKSFIELNENNLQFLLILNVVLLIVFFIIIFTEVKNSLKDDVNIGGSNSSRKYIGFLYFIYVNTFNFNFSFFIILIFFCFRKIF